MNIPLIPEDKANHVIWGAGIALVALTAARFFEIPLGDFRPKDFALMCACVLGFVKEVADFGMNKRLAAHGLTPTHGVEANDWLATCAGGFMIWAAA